MGRFFHPRLCQFQSTPPVKAATTTAQSTSDSNAISIHAAREGGDYAVVKRLRYRAYFNPRRP